MYAEAVSCSVPVTNGDARKIMEKPRRDGMHNQSVKGSIGILRQERVIVCETCRRRPEAASTTRAYARRDGGSLIKGHDEERTLYNLKEELIDLREKVSGLICWVSQDMGLGLS